MSMWSEANFIIMSKLSSICYGFVWYHWISRTLDEYNLQPKIFKNNMTEKKAKPPSLGVREIVREQVQLTRTEADLKKMIANINDQINQLLVNMLETKHCYSNE